MRTMKLNVISAIACLTMGAAVVTSSGCQGWTSNRPAAINHVVFFTLNDSSRAAELIADCDRRIAGIPGVESYFCGRHVDTGRESVDSNYDVGFYVGFDSFEDYARYVEHPEHKALVEDWQPHLREMLVRDVYDVTD